MSILALAQQKMIPIRVASPLVRAEEIFSRINKKGIFTIGCGAAIGIAVVSYLVAMVTLFHLGLRVQDSSVVIARLEQDVLKSQITLQQSDAKFAEAHKEILQSMEKISSIVYISLESVAAISP